jgi:tRNA threonylcarbamoyladenosine biosynthesis protein TsaE
MAESPMTPMTEPQAPAADLTLRAAIPGAAAMRQLGRRLAGVLSPGDLLVLSGPLGAGKTTLVQGIGDGLDVRGPITSPTFVIARVHPSLSGGPDLVHADAYRLGSRLEVDDLDLDADLDHAVTVVEWGEGLVEILAPDRLHVSIGWAAADGRDDKPGDADGPGDEPRLVTLTGHGPRWLAAAEQLRLIAAPALG